MSGDLRCQMKILELMKVHTIVSSPDATIAEVVDLFDLYQLSVLHIVDEDGKPIGSINEKQLSEYVYSRASGSVSGNAVMNIMRTPECNLDESSEVETAIALFRSHNIENLVVTSAGRLVGTVRRIDICQAILDGDIVLRPNI